MRTHILNRAAGSMLLLAGFGLAIAASSCTTPATEVVAGFTTQIKVPEELRSVAVVVTQGGRPIICRGYRVTDGTVQLPSTLGALPAPDRNGVPPEPVNISVIGFRTVLGPTFDTDCFINALPNVDEDAEVSNVMVVRRAALQYTKDSILYAPLPLKESCIDVKCGEQQTCIGGLCQSPDVTGVIYRDDLIFGDSNTCFNPELCMTGTLAIMTDPTNCTFRLPVPEDAEADTPRVPGNLNVEVIYNTLGTEILDLDEREGFTFPIADDPWTFQLASNLCQSQFLDPKAAGQPAKILGVYASPVCVAKRGLQPICTAALEDIQAGRRGPAASAVGGGADLCPFDAPLQATESLLYVLMDQSASMSEFYGEGGLEFAIGVPLDNPVAAKTRLAFSFMPAADSECDEGASYLSPVFGFEDPEKLKGDIGAVLSTKTTVLSGDSILNMDAAMRGAYTALRAISPVVSKTFNRKAIVVVGNRDFQTHCAGNVGLGEIAAAALADPDPIHSYAVVLSAPDDADNFMGPPPQTGGATIANNGGTTVFDAVGNEAEGALAVQKVFNELGSCLYDPVSTEVQAELKFLSFVNPLTQEPTIVERNDSCGVPTDAVDGFGFDGDGQVVICGQPCQTLREALNDTAGYFAALQQPAPAIPILPSLSCARKAELFEELVLKAKQ